MVIVFDAQAAETPVGSPVAVPIPVAPVVVCVMLVKGVLMHKVGVDEAEPTVLFGETVRTPLMFVVPFHKPPPPALKPPYCQAHPFTE